MSLLLTFMELDKLYESTMSRQDLIAHIKASGRNYNLENKSTKQLFRIWERIQKEDNEAAGMQEYHELINKEQARLCKDCGKQLNDSGNCMQCSEDEADYIFDESLFEWLDSKGNSIKASSNNASTQSVPVTTTSNASNIVTIVYDYNKHKLRAQADDGIHGIGNVAFPNNLRTAEGQQYEVGSLIWNGKNYRVSGSIKAV